MDTSGNAFVAGTTNSSDFPTQNPFQTDSIGSDAFVSKVNPEGNSLVYSTYLGGSAPDDCKSIAIDFTGAAYVTGDTNSLDFPTQNPFQSALAGSQDIFVSKLSVAGNSLAYSTYLGGSESDYGHEIAVDAARSPHVTGFTRSTNFPIQKPLQSTYAGGGFDVFVARLGTAGIVWHSVPIRAETAKTRALALHWTPSEAPVYSQYKIDQLSYQEPVPGKLRGLCGRFCIEDYAVAPL